jgi:hypothetical protein
VGLIFYASQRCAIPGDRQNSLKYQELNSHHHDNGNVMNQSSMDIGPFITNLSDKAKSYGVLYGGQADFRNNT